GGAGEGGRGRAGAGGKRERERGGDEDAEGERQATRHRRSQPSFRVVTAHLTDEDAKRFADAAARGGRRAAPGDAASPSRSRSAGRAYGARGRGRSGRDQRGRAPTPAGR